MHKVRLFLNDRSSSQAKVAPQIELVKQKLFRSELDFVSPNSYEELKNELARAVNEKIDVVVSVGGDGTVNTLIQSLGGTDTAFLIIPAGTANDLAREMGLIRRIDKAIDLIRGGEPEKIDLIKINDLRMATNGGIGIAGEVADHVNILRNKIPGFKKAMSVFRSKMYSLILGYEILIPDLKLYELSIESKEFTGNIRSPLLLINNQAALGGEFKVASQTRNNDGTFNVSAFLHTNKKDFLKAVMHIRLHGEAPKNDPNFLSFECQELKLKSYKPVLFFGDGESFERNTQFDIKIEPNALKVYGYRHISQQIHKQEAHPT
jgi:diacylglycerol kinase family enzyme